jgi:hypothetical protein
MIDPGLGGIGASPSLRGDFHAIDARLNEPLLFFKHSAM